MTDDVNERRGYKKPPVSTRFRNGQSGNPNGRPRGRRNEFPSDTVLGQLVTIREDGVERRVTAAETSLLHLTKQGLDGDGAAARSATAAIENAHARALGRVGSANQLTVCIRSFSGAATNALELLRMAKKLDRYCESARVVLEPWLVEQALARLGERRLSRDEQETVVRATRTPRKVRWPSWWEVIPS